MLINSKFKDSNSNSSSKFKIQIQIQIQIYITSKNHNSLFQPPDDSYTDETDCCGTDKFCNVYIVKRVLNT